MHVLGFAGGLDAVRPVGHFPPLFVPLLVCLCLAIAGGMMLFRPDLAFRTPRKPRWLGLPFFFIGLLGALEWLMRVF